MRLYCFIGSFAAGVVAQTRLALPLSFALFAAFLGAAVFVYAIAAIPKNERSKFVIVPLLMLGAALGLGRTFAAQAERPSGIERFADGKIEARGVVVSEPDAKDEYAKIAVRLSAVSTGEGTVPADDVISANVPLYPRFSYGDEITLKGKLARPRNFEDGEFDYVSYLGKDGIRFVMSRADAELLQSGKGNFLKERLFAFKYAAAEKMSSVVPEPQASLVAGVLLGIKSSLGAGTLGDFKTAGLTHILVLSGYNVSLVAESALKLFASVPRAFRFGAGFFSIALFALMAGGTASVVRASIMSGLVLVSKMTWRRYDALRALFVAGFAMTMLNPLILAHDPSFALSFLAALSLVVVSPIVAPRLRFVTERWGFREMVASTVSAQLVVMPHLLRMSGSLSLISFVANAFVLPAIPGVMLFGALAAALSFVSKHLAFVPGLPAYALASYVLAAAKGFASLPFASVRLPLAAWGEAAWYAAYAYLAWRLRPSPSRTEKAPAVDVSLAYEIVE